MACGQLQKVMHIRLSPTSPPHPLTQICQNKPYRMLRNEEEMFAVGLLNSLILVNIVP